MIVFRYCSNNLHEHTHKERKIIKELKDSNTGHNYMQLLGIGTWEGQRQLLSIAGVEGFCRGRSEQSTSTFVVSYSTS